MLFWTKLLTVAHAVTSSVHPYLCLYYIHTLRIDILTIAMLFSFIMIIRVPASIFWINLVDHKDSLHGIFTGLLTAVGASGILLVLSITPSWLAFALPAAIIASIFDGLFYQPLEPLIDSAIIKILGDYKILYDVERQYGKCTSAVMTLLIGWSLDDDHDFDTLMVTFLIGSVLLFLLSLSTSVQAADPSLLGISLNESNDETTYLLKQNLHNTDILGPNMYYKPYSLFGEELSHISEEDASMLQRISTTNNSASIRPLQRHESVFSTSSILSHTNCDNNNIYHSHRFFKKTLNSEYEDSAFFHQNYTIQNSHNSTAYIVNNTYRHAVINYFDSEINFSSSFELARLPFPPSFSPMVVLISFFPSLNNFFELSSQQHRHYLSIEEDNCYQLGTNDQKPKWAIKSFVCSMLLLGMIFGMTQILLFPYLHDVLEFPMHMIGIIGSIAIIADILASTLAVKIVQQLQLPVIIVSAHFILFSCNLAYIWLQPALISTMLIIIILQFFQNMSFSLIWLLAAHQVDSVILTDRNRMLLKGLMSSLYSSVGPALGTLLAGYMLNENFDCRSYSQLCQYASVLAIVSTLTSWIWSTTE